MEEAAATPQTVRLRGLMLEVSRLMNVADRFESTCCGVTVGQCLTLTTLQETGAVTGQQLAETLGLAPSTVTRAITPLVRTGWVRRRRDRTDRRQVWLSLTDAGAAKAVELAERADTLYAGILARVPAAEREQTLHALDTLLNACRGVQLEQDTADRLRCA